jgi:hypothetical protein
MTATERNALRPKLAISDRVCQIKPRLPHLKRGTAYCCRIEALRTPCREFHIKHIEPATRWRHSTLRSDHELTFQ